MQFFYYTGAIKKNNPRDLVRSNGRFKYKLKIK